jgi:hypothetical protein
MPLKTFQPEKKTGQLGFQRLGNNVFNIGKPDVPNINKVHENRACFTKK